MGAIHYGQFLDASFAGQSDEDDCRALSAPARVLSGPSFKIHYIPKDPSTYTATERYIFSVKIDASTVAGLLMTTTANQVRLHNGGSSVLLSSKTYSAGDALSFTITPTTLTLEGFTSGDGTVAFFGWNLTDNEWRLGGDVLGDGKSARGYVSLPYPI